MSVPNKTTGAGVATAGRQAAADGSSNSGRIAVLPGDGIGPEVMEQSLRVLEAAASKFDITIKLDEGLIGGAAIDATGSPLPEATVALCKASDAILLGSVGGPKWDGLPFDKRPERGGLLAIRKLLGLYANLRPVRLYPSLAAGCPVRLRPGTTVDLLTVRELSSGAYFGEPRVLNDELGLDTMAYTATTVRRIAEVGFQAAARRRGKLTSVDKANVLASSMLWRKVVLAMAPDWPAVTLNHLYADNAAMQLILDPGQFDVIVTENLFGDILSDESAALAGSLGMLPSASLGDQLHLYEPAGGSAPDLAGKGIANPIAQILSAAMLLEYSFNRVDAARAIEAAVEAALADGYRTADIAGGGHCVGTREMTEAIMARLTR
jgi:3-isopropylmalate dehydrogenase